MNETDRARWAAESLARKRAFVYLQGWSDAAGRHPADKAFADDPDYVAGWRSGVAAKNAARGEAERLTGHKFAVIKVAGSGDPAAVDGIPLPPGSSRLSSE